MSKKIALINPPSPFLINERVAYNSGLMRVATQLNADGHDAKIYDLAGNKDYMNTIKDIARQDFDLYGFSATSPQFTSVYKMFHTLKQENPNARTLIGGPHANAVGSLRKKGIKDHNIYALGEFDTIYQGEAELGNANKMFEDGWVDGGLVKKIDDTLHPDRSLMDILSYVYNLNGKKTTNIQTQRGCPNVCTFCCGRDIDIYRKVRQHSPERVVEEMDRLNKDYGYESFMWYDDEVNVNISRLEKLCKELKDKPYQHRGFVTSDQIVKYPESVKWMKDAGFVKLCTGVESGSDRILERIGKKTTYDINKKAREIIGEHGIHYEAFLIVGHPSETKEDIEKTKQFIEEVKPDDFDINILTPYPGSKIYNEAKESDEIKGYNFESNGLFFNKPNYAIDETYYKGLDAQSASNVRTREISNAELFEIRNKIQRMRK